MHLSMIPSRQKAPVAALFADRGSMTLDDGALLTLDMSGNIITCAGGAERFFGCPGTQLVGRPVRQFLPALAFGDAMPRFNLAYVQFWFSNGRWRWMNAMHAAGKQPTVDVSVAVRDERGMQQMIVRLRPAANRRRPACTAP